MIWDKTVTADCIVPVPQPPDPRCDSSDFALQNPDICSSIGALIIKPSSALLCHLDSLQFRVFEYKNGTETELTDGVWFESSVPEIFAVGVNSGSGTALTGGEVIVTATYLGKTVSATITAKATENCCDDVIVASAIVVDNSRSMSLGFGGAYPTRLNYAKAIATSYGGTMYYVDNVPKDTVSVYTVSSALASLLSESQNPDEITSQIASIVQTQNKTDLLSVFTTAAQALLDQEADRRVLLLVSDCEQTATSERQAIIDAAFLFKQAGGIVIVIAPRSSSTLLGFDLAERIATGGFFINVTRSVAVGAGEQIPLPIGEYAFRQLNRIKELLCAGQCTPVGDTYANLPMMTYAAFINWEVTEGIVNLLGPGLLDFLPGNGLYVEFSAAQKTTIKTIDSYELDSGHVYRVSFRAAGNQQSTTVAQGLRVSVQTSSAVLFETTVYPAWNDDFSTYNFSFTAPYNATAWLYFDQSYAGTIIPGTLLDDVLFKNETTGVTLLNDNFDDENLTYISPVCGASAEITELVDPDAPVVTVALDEGAGLPDTEAYTYSLSAVTSEGETAATISSTIPALAQFDGTILRITWPVSYSDRILKWRLWRSLGTDTFSWPGDGEPRYLLAELPATQTTYLDSERSAAFTARHEPSVTEPTENTTAVAGGGLGAAYGGACCYHTYDVYDVPETPIIDGLIANFYLTREKDGSDDIYVFSFVTADGETKVTRDLSGSSPTTNVDPDQILPLDVAEFSELLALQMADPSITHVNVWRLKSCSGDPFEPDANFRFLASIPKDALALTDTLNCTDWIAAAPEQAPPTENTTGAPASQTLTDVYTNICPECSTETVGAQTPENPPLPDIELNSPPIIQTFTSTICKSCPTGFINISTVNLIPAMTGNTAPSGEASASSSYTTYLPWKAFDRGTASSVWASNGALPQWLQYQSAAAVTAAIYSITSYKAYGPKAWTLQGSNNGTTWTTLDTRSNQAWGFNQRKLFQITTPAAYTYHRITVSEVTSPPDIGIGAAIGEMELFAAAPTQACSSATSQVNQATADNLATTAALAQLYCTPIFTETRSHTAQCQNGLVGPGATKSATKTSLNNATEAGNEAQVEAQVLAEAELASNPSACEGSNNTVNIVINDRIGTEPERATPYPSVSFQSGLTGTISKVVVTLNRFNHGDYGDVAILLVSPEGTGVYLLGNAMNAAHDTIDRIIHFDDDAVDSVPENTRPGGPGDYEFTYKPTVYVGQIAPFPAPAPPPIGIEYETLLSSLDGENPNGAWKLFILDDTSLNTGYVLYGWSLEITTV